MTDDYDDYRRPEYERSMLPAALAVVSFLLLALAFLIAGLSYYADGLADLSAMAAACVEP